MDMSKLRKDKRLSMALRAIIDTPNSDRKVSATILVFEVCSEMPGDGNCGTVLQIANIIQKHSDLLIKIKMRGVIKEAKNVEHSPRIGEI